MTYRIEVDTKTGNATIMGHAHPKLKVIYLWRDYMVIHRSPGSHWVGLQMDRGYDKATYEVYQIEELVNEEEYNQAHITAKRLFEFNARHEPIPPQHWTSRDSKVA